MLLLGRTLRKSPSTSLIHASLASATTPLRDRGPVCVERERYRLTHGTASQRSLTGTESKLPCSSSPPRARTWTSYVPCPLPTMTSAKEGMIWRLIPGVDEQDSPGRGSQEPGQEPAQALPRLATRLVRCPRRRRSISQQALGASAPASGAQVLRSIADLIPSSTRRKAEKSLRGHTPTCASSSSSTSRHRPWRTSIDQHPGR